VLYGAEIWGLKEVREIEREHVFALKTYLNVASQTPSTMVYAETGPPKLVFVLPVASATCVYIKAQETMAD
jgi:hypothetical protein